MATNSKRALSSEELELIQLHRDEDLTAIERARQTVRDIDLALERSKRIRREVLPELRRRGLVR